MMRIGPYAQVQQIYGSKKSAKVPKTANTSLSDQIQISSIGKDIQAAKVAVAASSDIREDVIAPLKASVQADTYQVSGERFAEKLLRQYEEIAGL